MRESERIAWEQVWCWRTFMTAAEAGAAVGLGGTPNWAAVARRLEHLWLDLGSAKYMREAA